MPLFNESTNTQAYAKVALMGFAGSGKTRTAAEIAMGLHDELRKRKLPGGSQPVFFLDTETGSDWVKPIFTERGIKLNVAKTRAFADLCPAIIEVAKVKGIVLIDSLTHFWRELTETYAKKKNRTKGLIFSDWAWLKGPNGWGKFTDLLINSPAHIIFCGRSAFEYDLYENEDGKKELEKTGIKMSAEKEAGYEPNMLILMERHQDISTDPMTVWRTAVVLKDRSDRLDGKVFRNPTFKDFKPHFDFLNLGGEQLGTDQSRNSESIIPSDDNSWKRETEQREVLCEEIMGILVKHYPSTAQAEKAKKASLLEKHFGTLSWKAVELMGLADLKRGYAALRAELEPSDDVAPWDAAEAKSDTPTTEPPSQPAGDGRDAVQAEVEQPPTRDDINGILATKLTVAELDAAVSMMNEQWPSERGVIAEVASHRKSKLTGKAAQGSFA